MKPKIIALFVFICTSFLQVSAQDVSGEWNGYLDQSEAASKLEGYQIYWDKGEWNKGEVTHDLTLNFEPMGDGFTGIYYIITAKDKASYGQFSISATFKNQVLVFKTVRKLKEVRNKLGFGFCYCEAELKYREDAEYEYLEGAWTGWSERGNPCASATIMVRRKKESMSKKNVEKPQKSSQVNRDKRKVVKTQKVNVVQERLKLTIWDENYEDGDIVSLKLNDEWIVEALKVTNKKKELFLSLQDGKNVLILFAENLGQVPPNTAAISFMGKDGPQQMVLNSDMGKSEAITIFKE